MDPIVTLRELLYAILCNDAETAEEKAEALHGWLERGGFAPVSQQKEPYQGWHNYQTWAVHLWLTGDQATDRACLSIASHVVRGAPQSGQVRAGIWSLDDAPRFLLADCLKEFVDARSPLRDAASVYSDLLGSALYEVDWLEVADAFLERIKT